MRIIKSGTIDPAPNRPNIIDIREAVDRLSMGVSLGSQMVVVGQADRPAMSQIIDSSEREIRSINLIWGQGEVLILGCHGFGDDEDWILGP